MPVQAFTSRSAVLLRTELQKASRAPSPAAVYLSAVRRLVDALQVDVDKVQAG